MHNNNYYQHNLPDVGDIETGRPNLGNMTSVAVYRLAQYAMRTVLINTLGRGEADKCFFNAGKLAGTEFCNKYLPLDADFNTFMQTLYDALIELKAGVMRVEDIDFERLEVTLTISEDLDCSGLPVTNETVCTYDEGFLAGVLSAYLKKEFDVKEVDCWSTGERTCRFKIKPKPESYYEHNT